MSVNSVGEEMYRILIVDDHPIVRKGLCALMEQESGLFVCGEAANVDQATKLVETLSPHLVIVDLSLQDGEGLELIKSLRTGYPDLLIMVLSMHQETVFAERAIRAGARGYVMKLEPPENIVTAIRGVLKGDIYVSENLAAGILKNLASGEKTAVPVGKLSDRELQVFLLVGQGLGTKRIAEKLNLSVKTIETYQANIKHKMAFTSAEELKQYAIAWEKCNHVWP